MVETVVGAPQGTYDDINVFLTMAWQVANHTRPNSSCYVCGLMPYTAGEGLPLMALPASDCDTCRLLHISFPKSQSGPDCSNVLEMKMRPLNCSAKATNCYRCLETPKPVPVVVPQPLSWCLENKGRRPVGRSDCLQTFKWDQKQTDFHMNHFASAPQQCLEAAGRARLDALARRSASCSISSPVGMYWVCGNVAYPYLPVDYDGRCGLAYVVPAMRVTHSLPQKPPHRRSRRGLSNIFGTHHQSPLKNMLGPLIPFYGVMSALDQIADLSNAIEVIANETGKALMLVSSELASVRLLALQNRAALDFLLAARGGTCAVLGSECCTFVPDYNATIFDVINHLHSTANSVHQITNPTSSLFDWLTPAFGPLAYRLVEAVVTLTVLIVLLSLLTFCVRKCLFVCCKTN